MLKKLSAVLIIMLVLSVTGVVHAGYVDVDVNGQSGPWDIAVNPLKPYGVPVNGQANNNLGPAVVGSSLLPMTPGDTLTINWLSGNVCGGANGSAWTNGGLGNASWGTYNTPADAVGTPAKYVPADQFPVVFMQLMGVFADSSGVVVGDPFMIRNGPVNLTIPVGASQLQMGFVDGWYNDNFATLQVRVTESASAIPEPATMLLFGLGLVGLAGVRRYRS